MISNKLIASEKRKQSEEHKAAQVAAETAVAKFIARGDLESAMEEAYNHGIISEVSKNILKQAVCHFKDSDKEVDLKIAIAIYDHLGDNKARTSASQKLDRIEKYRAESANIDAMCRG